MPIIFVFNQLSCVLVCFVHMQTYGLQFYTVGSAMGLSWLRFWEIWKRFIPPLRQTHQTIFSSAVTSGSVPGSKPAWYQQTFNHHHPTLRLISKPIELWLDLIKEKTCLCVCVCVFRNICECLRKNGASCSMSWLQRSFSFMFYLVWSQLAPW